MADTSNSQHGNSLINGFSKLLPSSELLKNYKKGSVKYIFVTGGVLSGLGKGIATSSIAFLLQSRGYKICPIKIDGYLNVDAGTMNPFEHGEVFVLDDGTECDMDLGNYERFLHTNLDGHHSLTTGKIMSFVLGKERRGDYLGKTVQVIPHVTGEIKDFLRTCAVKDKSDFCVVEVGGTVGDLESAMFLEAARELRIEEGRENVAFIHVTLVPVLDSVGEQKTKPTQQSVRELMGLGIQPDMILARSHEPLAEKVRKKLALFCNTENIFSDPDLKSVYAAPLYLEEEGVVKALENQFSLSPKNPKLDEWKKFVDRLENPSKEITIAITGKYTDLKDSYVSIFESLSHCSSFHNVKINPKYVETTELSYEDAQAMLKDVDGVIVPGGFGSRGTEGKINCIRVCREKNIPFLGLCFGLQLATIEFARNVVGIKDATSTEFEGNCKSPVIHMQEEQKHVMGLGGTMRLGSFENILKQGSVVSKLYGNTKISERHRHRFEVNQKYVQQLEKAGLVFSGKYISKGHELIENIELPGHKFFVGTQAHPEFKSRPLKPHPLFNGFVAACLGKEIGSISEEPKAIEN